MTRDTVLAVWLLLAVLLAGCEVLAVASRHRFTGFLALVRRFSEQRPALAALVLGWMWLGWHCFAR